MQLRDFVVSVASGVLAISWLSAGAAHSEEEPRLQASPSEARQGQPEAAGGSAQLSEYRRIIVHPVQLAYTKEFSRDAWKERHKIGSRDLDRIRRYFIEAVEEELAESYPIAAEPGPDVLRIDPVLVDAVVDKSDWLAPARDSFKKREKLMLVALLRDSQTGEIVHRVLVDIRPFGDVVMRQSPLTYWDDMRFLLRLLAKRVLWTMESNPQSSAIASIHPGVES